MRITKSALKRIIKEELAGKGTAKGGTGLPSPNEVSRKLSAAGPDAAIDWLARVLKQMDLGAAGSSNPVPAEPPMPEPPIDEEL